MDSRDGRGMAIMWPLMLLLLHLCFSPALAVVYDKCGACKAVAVSPFSFTFSSPSLSGV